MIHFNIERDTIIDISEQNFQFKAETTSFLNKCYTLKLERKNRCYFGTVLTDPTEQKQNESCIFFVSWANLPPTLEWTRHNDINQENYNFNTQRIKAFIEINKTDEKFKPRSKPGKKTQPPIQSKLRTSSTNSISNTSGTQSQRQSIQNKEEVFIDRNLFSSFQEQSKPLIKTESVSSFHEIISSPIISTQKHLEEPSTSQEIEVRAINQQIEKGVTEVENLNETQNLQPLPLPPQPPNSQVIQQTLLQKPENTPKLTESNEHSFDLPKQSEVKITQVIVPTQTPQVILPTTKIQSIQQKVEVKVIIQQNTENELIKSFNSENQVQNSQNNDQSQKISKAMTTSDFKQANLKHDSNELMAALNRRRQITQYQLQQEALKKQLIQQQENIQETINQELKQEFISANNETDKPNFSQQIQIQNISKNHSDNQSIFQQENSVCLQQDNLKDQLEYNNSKILSTQNDIQHQNEKQQKNSFQTPVDTNDFIHQIDLQQQQQLTKGSEELPNQEVEAYFVEKIIQESPFQIEQNTKQPSNDQNTQTIFPQQEIQKEVQTSEKQDIQEQIINQNIILERKSISKQEKIQAEIQRLGIQEFTEKPTKTVQSVNQEDGKEFNVKNQVETQISIQEGPVQILRENNQKYEIKSEKTDQKNHEKVEVPKQPQAPNNSSVLPIIQPIKKQISQQNVDNTQTPSNVRNSLKKVNNEKIKTLQQDNPENPYKGLSQELAIKFQRRRTMIEEQERKLREEKARQETNGNYQENQYQINNDQNNELIQIQQTLTETQKLSQSPTIQQTSTKFETLNTINSKQNLEKSNTTINHNDTVRVQQIEKHSEQLQMADEEQIVISKQAEEIQNKFEIEVDKSDIINDKIQIVKQKIQEYAAQLKFETCIDLRSLLEKLEQLKRMSVETPEVDYNTILQNIEIQLADY